MFPLGICMFLGLFLLGNRILPDIQLHYLYYQLGIHYQQDRVYSQLCSNHTSNRYKILRDMLPLHLLLLYKNHLAGMGVAPSFHPFLDMQIQLDNQYSLFLQR